MKTWPKEVRIVVHNMPLAMHKRATPAALAAMAAGEQGKFWQYHDLLFADTKRKFTDPELEAYATQLQLDLPKWKADKDSKRLATFVQRQNKSCTSAGASGTPSFFVNGRKAGGTSFDQFKPLIEEELKKARKMVENGIARKDVYTEILKKAAGTEERPVRMNLDDSPSMGPANAVATLVVWSDFQ